MRLAGNEATSIRPEAEVVLRRPNGQNVTLTVLGLAPDWPERVEEEIPTPKPRRTGVLKDKKGRVLLHPSTNKPIPAYEDEDPVYLKRLQKAQQLQTVKMILDGLAPGQVEFDTKKGPDIEEYYQSVRDEMATFGFTLGDLAAIVDAIKDVSGISDDEVDEATEAFFAATT